MRVTCTCIEPMKLIEVYNLFPRVITPALGCSTVHTLPRHTLTLCGALSPLSYIHILGVTLRCIEIRGRTISKLNQTLAPGALGQCAYTCGKWLLLTMIYSRDKIQYIGDFLMKIYLSTSSPKWGPTMNILLWSIFYYLQTSFFTFKGYFSNVSLLHI